MISGDRALAEGKHGAFYNTLEELHKYFERIDVITPRAARGPRQFFGNVYLHSSPWPLLFQPFWIIKKSKEIFKETGFDLMTVHEYPPFYNGLGAFLLSRATKAPYLLEIMHIPGLPKAANFKELFYRWLTGAYIERDSKPAKAIRIINQNQTKKFMISAGVPAEKLVYTPAFYIDTEIFKPKPIEKKYDLVYAARLEANKGISNLVRAVAILKKEKPDVSLLIIGSGPLKRKIEKEIKDLRLAGNVRFSGWLPDSEAVSSAMNEGRIFINPALNEGGPRVALEAMACGLPVISTRVGIMLDILKDGDNGMFCGWKPEEIASSVSGLLQAESARKRFSEAGLEIVKGFEKRLAIKNYADGLKKLI